MNDNSKNFSKTQKAVLEKLKVSPIIQIACKKVGIARASYYRWRKENPQFAHEADKSLMEGRLLINDMAESQLLSAIREKHMTAIIYWLNHNHPNYGNKVELLAKIHHSHEDLSKEQQQLIEKALKLANVLENNLIETPNENN